nr:hypothetical protein [Tanacetum cinerariifolium]
QNAGPARAATAWAGAFRASSSARPAPAGAAARVRLAPRQAAQCAGCHGLIRLFRPARHWPAQSRRDAGGIGGGWGRGQHRRPAGQAPGVPHGGHRGHRRESGAYYG